MERFYSRLIGCFNKSFCAWHLTDSTLAYFVANGTIKGCKEIHVAVIDDQRSYKNHTEILDYLSSYRIVIHEHEDIISILKEMPDDFDQDNLHFPTNLGAVLDKYNPAWSELFQHKRKYPEECFFKPDRRQNGYDLIRKEYECGRKAGIADKMFLGFGSALGYALYGDFLPNDDDVDLCFLPGISQTDKEYYLYLCKEAGLNENRMAGPNMVGKDWSWFSIGPKSIFKEQGVKSCNWFWFEFGGYLWHTKGDDWIGIRGMDDRYATAKGIPLSIFDMKLKPAKFGDVDVYIPVNLGQCLDWWYPGWLSRKKEQSAAKALLVMKDEFDPLMWHMVIK